MMLAEARTPSERLPSLAAPANPPSTVSAFLWFLVAPLRGTVAVVLLFGVVIAAFDLGKPYAIKLVVDRISTRAVGGDVGPFLLPFALFMTFQGGSGMLAQLRKLVYIRLRVAAGVRLVDSMFASLTAQPIKFFADRMSGNVSTRVTVAYRDVEQLLHGAMILFWPGFLTFLGGQILLGRLSIGLAAAVGVYVAMMITGTVVLSRNLRTRSREHAASLSGAMGRLTDAIANMTAVKLFGREAEERQGIHRAVTEAESLGLAVGRHVETVNFVQSVFVVVLVALLWGGAYRLYAADRITVGDFVLITAIGIRLSDWAERLGHLVVDLLAHQASLSECLRVIVPVDAAAADSAGPPLVVRSGAIRFRDVDFQYDAHRRVFSKLNVEILGGQRVALVGRSGAGKTTFINLILRFYDPQRGTIEIDGQDVRAVSVESLRAAFSVIPQDTGLFSRSIADNIRYGRPAASDEDVARAAAKARAAEFIDELEHGYDDLVGERGVRLSGGQRQRLVIARAFLKDAPIVLLDEASAALDSLTEAKVTTALEELFAGRTAIIITHRLATAAHADRILVLDDGRIVEDGVHAALLARGGHYAALWREQSA